MSWSCGKSKCFYDCLVSTGLKAYEFVQHTISVCIIFMLYLLSSYCYCPRDNLVTFHSFNGFSLLTVVSFSLRKPCLEFPAVRYPVLWAYCRKRSSKIVCVLVRFPLFAGSSYPLLTSLWSSMLLAFFLVPSIASIIVRWGTFPSSFLFHARCLLRSSALLIIFFRLTLPCFSSLNASCCYLPPNAIVVEYDIFLLGCSLVEFFRRLLPCSLETSCSLLLPERAIFKNSDAIQPFLWRVDEKKG